MTTKQEEPQKKTHICNFCSKIIVGSSYKFNAHLFLHENSSVEPRFQCSYCSKQYYRRDAYEQHCASHNDQKRKLHICDHCDRGFVDKRSLIAHLKVHDDFFDTPRPEYKCKACGTAYCEERLLKYHIRKHHFNLNETPTHTTKKEMHTTKKVNETWVERVMESEICVEITKLEQNEMIFKKTSNVSGEKSKFDPKNLEISSFRDYMSSIFAANDNTQYSKAVCDYCNKEMLKKSLRPHIRERHLKLKRFGCDVCEAKFSRHYQLVNHVCGKPRYSRKGQGLCK